MVGGAGRPVWSRGGRPPPAKGARRSMAGTTRDPGAGVRLGDRDIVLTSQDVRKVRSPDLAIFRGQSSAGQGRRRVREKYPATICICSTFSEIRRSWRKSVPAGRGSASVRGGGGGTNGRRRSTAEAVGVERKAIRRHEVRRDGSCVSIVEQTPGLGRARRPTISGPRSCFASRARCRLDVACRLAGRGVAVRRAWKGVSCPTGRSGGAARSSQSTLGQTWSDPGRRSSTLDRTNRFHNLSYANRAAVGDISRCRPREFSSRPGEYSIEPAGCSRESSSVAAVVALAAVREAAEPRDIRNLVLATRRRGMTGSADGRSGKIDVGKFRLRRRAISGCPGLRRRDGARPDVIRRPPSLISPCSAVRARS